MSEAAHHVRERVQRSARIKPGAVDPAELAFAALTYLAEDEGRLERFLAITGLTPAAIREMIGKPYFTTGILDYVVTSDELVLGLADAARIRPEEVYWAREGAYPKGVAG